MAEQFGDVILWNLVALLIVSVLCNLFLFDRQMKNKSVRQMKKLFPKMLQQFARDQVHRSFHWRKFRERKNLGHIPSTLRQSYLTIEDKAVSRKIDSKDYWNYLGSALHKHLHVAASLLDKYPLESMKARIEAIKK